MNFKFIPYLISIVIILSAVYFGLLVGSADYQTLSIYVVTTFVIWYIITGWRITWKIAALFTFSGFSIYQGFLIDATHMMVMMVCCASGLAVFYRNTPSIPSIFRTSGINGLRWSIGLLIFYGLIHGIYNYAYPYSPHDYDTGNAAKGYFATYSAFGLMFWISGGPFQFSIKPNWQRTLWLIVTFTMIANVVYLILMMRAGYGANVQNDYFAKDWIYSFHIPVINLTLNRFHLRTFSSLVLFIAILMCLNRGWMLSHPMYMRILVLINVPLCLLGAVISGGRGAVVLCIFFAFCALIHQRRRGFIIAGVMAGVLGIISVNLFSRFIDQNAPLYVARTLQLVMIEKGQAYDTITASDISRDYAAQAGWNEWLSDDRIFWFGRSIYKHLGVDYYAILKRQVGEHEAFAAYQVRSATVHNLYGDIVIQYGVLGAILYTIAMLSCIIFCIRLYLTCKRHSLPHVACDLAFFCAVSLPVLYLTQIKGGGYLMVIYPLIIGLIRSIISQVEREQFALNTEQIGRISPVQTQ